MTQGPATSTSGLPPPMRKAPSSSGITAFIIRAKREGGLEERGGLDVFGLGDRLGNRPDAMRHLVLIRGLDKGRKERMWFRRLGLEFRVELDGDVPRMFRQL